MAEMRMTGRYDGNIDAKGRVVIPAKFREMLGGDVTIVAGEGRSLVIYPQAKWEKLTDEFARVSTFDEDALEYVRYVMSNAYEGCEVDKQGRLLIQQGVRERAELEKGIAFVGMIDRIELWNREELDARNQQSHQNRRALSQTMQAYRRGGETT